MTDTYSNLDPLALIKQLIALPGPPGQEGPVRQAVAAHVAAMGLTPEVDAKGNLLVRLCPDGRPGRGARAVVTAHMDEIALMVSRVEPDGTLRVTPLGGLHPWKWGEQPVELLTESGAIPAALSFGCVHTECPTSTVQQARSGPLQWDHALLFTGRSSSALAAAGVRPGTRAVLHRDRRTVLPLGEHLCAHFLDDRADLAVWLITLDRLRSLSLPGEVVFIATTMEEIGGEGAAYALSRLRPDICIALEIGPTVPECPFEIDNQPTVWVNDSYSATSAEDIEILAAIGRSLGQRIHWQALSRGGSDASCAAQRGHAARPVTLGFPVENSHGLEVMHRNAVEELARLTAAYIREVAGPEPRRRSE